MFKKNNARFAGPMNQFQGQMYGDPGFQPGMMQGMPQGMQGMPQGMQGMPQGMPQDFQPEGGVFPQAHEDRLQFEIRENRRRINNLTRRVIRLENYLRIRDSSEYVNIDDDHIPNEFSL